MTTFLSSRDIYEAVICGIVPQVRERLWIATADIKDMYVDTGGREMVPFLEVLDGMVKRGIDEEVLKKKSPDATSVDGDSEGVRCGERSGESAPSRLEFARQWQAN